MLSTAERKYVAAGVAANVRADGRGRLDYRYVEVHTGVLPQCNGSARVKLVGSSTDVVAAVKLEVGAPAAGAPTEGRVSVMVECGPSVQSRRRVWGGNAAPEALNDELSEALDGAVNCAGAVDMTQLGIVPGKYCWIARVDVMVLDGSGGNLGDTCCLAAYAALNTTAVPRTVPISVEGGARAGEEDFEVDPDVAAAQLLDAAGMPVSITALDMGGRFIIDATLEEEMCATASLTVVADRGRHICCVRKGGEGTLAPDASRAVVQSVPEIASVLFTRLDAVLEEAKRAHARTRRSRVTAYS